MRYIICTIFVRWKLELRPTVAVVLLRVIQCYIEPRYIQKSVRRKSLIPSQFELKSYEHREIAIKRLWPMQDFWQFDKCIVFSFMNIRNGADYRRSFLHSWLRPYFDIMNSNGVWPFYNDRSGLCDHLKKSLICNFFIASRILVSITWLCPNIKRQNYFPIACSFVESLCADCAPKFRSRLVDQKNSLPDPPLNFVKWSIKPG